ncbi:MFS general substrate transporter [Hyaloscypha variabilis F]|uniref:MFS general substrate transporter n=1 Tax=Hyaloscypha variabilis (strain UAMH 11265 / GT02V1 / F) TaxID=1149755 RepID=A0A2J6RX09_HYAVF|nr:MFS general substrate transporter [Hyaloscypha variabilis F]
MNEAVISPTIQDNGSSDISRMDEKAGSSDTTTYAAAREPVTKLEPQSGKAAKAPRSVMIGHLSAPLAHFTDGDEGNPRNWAPKKKMAIAVFVIVAGFVATLGTPIYIAAVPNIAADFHVSTTLAILPISLYAYGLGVGALIASAASEIFGRVIVYKVTLPLSLIFTIVGGAAHNYSTLAAARFLAGTLAGPCVSLGGGVMNDLWNLSLDKTGTTFGLLYALGVMYATQTGPMISGSLLTYHSWRWTFWLSAILMGSLSVVAFLVPETHAPEILRSRAKRENLPVMKRGDSWEVFLASIGRPLHMIIVEPFVLPNGLVLAVTQSVVFAYYVIYAILFEQVYHFSQYQAGLTFAPLLIGGLIAVPVMGLFDRLTYQTARAEAIRSGTEVQPEKRLYPAMLSVILFPISLFWLAWSGRSSVHWIVPALSGVLFGLAYVLNILSISIYNNDVYAKHYGASVLAATTFLRFSISSSFPLFTPQMVHSLGFAWATSLLAFITTAMIPIPWVFFQWGPVLRSKSRYLQN